MTSSPPTSPVRRAWRPRASSLGRIALGVVAVLCMMLGLTLWIVTRPWFIVNQVQPLLSNAIGGTVTIDDAAYEGAGRFRFSGVRVTIPGVEGPGAEIGRIGRAVVGVDFDHLLTGRVRVRSLVLHDVRVRMSEDRRNAGVFNFMALRPQWSDVRGRRIVPPRVLLSNTIIEVGVHEGDAYVMHGARTVSGAMEQDKDREGLFRFTLKEVDPRGEIPDDGGFAITGEWDAVHNSHVGRIMDVALDERAYDMCPEIARFWWEQMALEGRVAEVELAWAGDRSFEIRFDVEDVGLTMPVETSELWARYRNGAIEDTSARPRMKVRSGTIRLSRESLRLENMVGEIAATEGGADAVGVPYRANLAILGLDEMDWSQGTRAVQDAVAASAYEMTFRADQFRVRGGDGDGPPAVVLPLAVAKALERFELSDWVLSTSLAVRRGAPSRDDEGSLVAADVSAEGQAYIANATATYEKFPYLLEDVESYIEFDSDRVQIHRLEGRGAGDTKVRLSGSIVPPARDARVSLTLTARDVPVDARLRGALTDAQQGLFDDLLHVPSAEALAAAGVLDPETFAVGGTVNLDLAIDREPGAGQRTVTTGRIEIVDLNVLFAALPYPLRATGGTIGWEADRIFAVATDDAPGLPITTPAGGRGWLGGEIRFLRDGETRAVRPDLTLRIESDPVTDALFAALPPSRQERDELEKGAWPGSARSRSATWLRDLEIGGLLDYSARITTDDAGAIDWTVDVGLRSGTARPARVLGEVIGAAGMLEPGSWALEECTADLSVDRRHVELRGFHGRHADGRVEVTGAVALDAEPSTLDLDVRLRRFVIGPSLLNLLPAGPGGPEDRIWARYEPEGTFDADLSYGRRGDVVERMTMRIEPNELALRVGDRNVRLERGAGGLRLGDGRITFDDLTVEVHTDERPDGTLSVNGAYGLRPDEETEPSAVVGTWSHGQLESPLIPEALRRLAGADAQAERYERLKPEGSFDAVFRYDRAAGAEHGAYDLRLAPETIAFVLGETPIFIELDPGAAVTFAPGLVALDGLHGRNVAGTFRVDGRITTGDVVTAELALDYEGRMRSAQVAAFLPPPLRTMLETLDLREGRPSRMRDGRLRLTQSSAPESPGGWDASFDGTLELQDATITAGLTFSELSGPFDVRVRSVPPETPRVIVTATPEHMKILGQDLTDIGARIELSDDARSVRLEELHATAGAGAVTANATIGIGANTAYAASAQLVDVPIAGFMLAPPEASEPPDASEPPAAPSAERSPDAPEGGLFAELEFSGERGRPELTVGRGTARVMGRRLADVPLALQLMQVFHASLPGAVWDYAEAEYYLAGRRAVFERILFESTRGDLTAQELNGIGSLDLETWDLDLHLRSRGGVLLVRDVVGGLGDQLAEIRVTGPIWDPVSTLHAPGETSRGASGAPVVEQRASEERLNDGP